MLLNLWVQVIWYSGMRMPPPPPPEGASGQHFVAKGISINSPWAPKENCVHGCLQPHHCSPLCTPTLTPSRTRTLAPPKRGLTDGH